MPTVYSLEPMNTLGYIRMGIKVIDRMNVANQLIQRWGDYPGLSGWAQRNHKVFINGRGRQKGGTGGTGCETDSMCHVPPLKTEGGQEPRKVGHL